MPHPIVQHMPPMDFAVSCSIAPGTCPGRGVIISTGLKNLTADYHVSNFYPQAEDRPDMRYGAFVQLWAMRHGAGRVVAFTDSTIFSNFSTFEPGKSELMLGMLEWLNHRNSLGDLRGWLVLAGVALLAFALFFARFWGDAWLWFSAAGLLGWALTCVAIQATHHAGMPLPVQLRPMVRVNVDRSLCSTKLSRSGFIAGDQDGFGLFEQWILRLGYFITRCEGERPPAEGDLLLFLWPSQEPGDGYRQALLDYVSSGGRVLVLDASQNEESTAGSLLQPFGLEVHRAVSESGSLEVPGGWPAVGVDSALEVAGGKPWARVNGKAVAATARHGKGTVTVVGFSSLFVDARMGATGQVIPDERLKAVFELEFTLLRAIIAGDPALVHED